MDVDLVLFKRDGSRKIISLREDTTVIGREDDCDLRVPLTSVSRKHCQLSYNDQTLKLQDFNSKNGTFLNGKRIKDETIAKAGDYITIGPLTFQLQIDGEPREVTPPKPPKPKPKPKPVPKETPKAKIPEEPPKKEPPKEELPKEEPEKEPDLDDSFPDINFDDSGSFAAELEDL